MRKRIMCAVIMISFLAVEVFGPGAHDDSTPGQVSARVLFDKAKDQENEENTAEANKTTAALLLEEIQEVNDRIADTSATIEEMYSGLAELDAEIEQSESYDTAFEGKL